MSRFNNSFSALVLSSLAFLMSGCGGGTSVGNPASPVEDSSTSGVAAEAAGGAVSASASAGTLAFNSLPAPSNSWLYAARASLNPFPSAFAAGVCPTFKSSAAAGCDATGDTMWLPYADCSFGGSTATWSGTQSLIMSSGSAACGSFPYPGANQTLIRQYSAASGSTAPGAVTITSSRGTVATIDNSSSNLGNFNGDSIATLANSGYGDEIHYSSLLVRDQVTVDQHIVAANQLDHSITGQISIAEAAGVTTRKLSGSLRVYHNLLKIIGTSTFYNVVHEDGCCFPVTGYVTTQFTAGTGASAATVAAYAGNSETLTFTGCGTATLLAVDGSSASVVLTRCF
jgi:hypothetical protein